MIAHRKFSIGNVYLQSNKDCLLINLFQIQIVTSLSDQIFVELTILTEHLSSQLNLCQLVNENEISSIFFFLIDCTLYQNFFYSYNYSCIISSTKSFKPISASSLVQIISYITHNAENECLSQYQVLISLSQEVFENLNVQ